MKNPLGASLPNTEPSRLVSKSSRAPEDVDAMMSRLVMGFIERRVSPQTLVDVVLAHARDSGLSGDSLQAATCNGLVESLASAPALAGLFDVMLLVARRKGFPSFLSPSATFGALSALLLNPHFNLMDLGASSSETYRIIDSLSKQCIEILGRNSITTNQKTLRMRLTNALKSSHHVVGNVGQVCPHLLILRQVLLKGVTPRPELLGQATFASIRSVILAIANTPDHVLVHHQPREYITVDVQKEPIRKLENLDEIMTALKGEGVGLSSFQASFLVEWLFSGTLESAARNSDDGATFGQALRTILQGDGLRLDVLKGIVRALQRDLSRIHVEYIGRTSGQHFVEIAQSTAQTIFSALNQPQYSLWSMLSQDFVPWAIQLACHPPESRLITRNHIEWMRTLDTRDWMDGLNDPPQWVLAGASQNAALIFDMAPGSWLCRYSVLFFEALHHESTKSEFIVGAEHFDFVEFVIRCLRRKSPLFASEVETLIALQVLGRCESSEQNQIRLALTRLRMTAAISPLERDRTDGILGLLTQPQTVDRLGPNPVARSLALMGRCARSVQLRTKRNSESDRRF